MPDRLVQRSDPVSGEESPTDVTIEVSVDGDVTAGEVEYARHRLETVLGHIREPLLFVRLKLAIAPDPARDRPALAQASIDIDGELLRAHVAAHEIREAADLLQRRLLHKVEQRASHRRALRRRGSAREPGEWRHGDARADRPDFYDRPAEERQLVRHKTFALDDLTPDEAAFDMELLDYDFHLFHDLASGEDAVLERLDGDGDGGSYRLTRLHVVDTDPGPSSITLAVAEHPPPAATVRGALDLLSEGTDRFLFFEDVDTGRGTVVYRRLDGHYGLITSS